MVVMTEEDKCRYESRVKSEAVRRKDRAVAMKRLAEWYRQRDISEKSNASRSDIG